MFCSANPAFQTLSSWNNGRSTFRAAVAAAVSVVALVGSMLLSAEADATQRTVQASGPAGGLVRVISAPDANGTRYLGGDFSTFNPWLTGMGAMVGAASGQVNSSFPQVNGDSIRDSAPDGLGGVYIVGDISTVDGTSRPNAAHINADGSLDTSWNPAPNAGVMSVAVSGTAVYLGGNFTSVGGASRDAIAAVNKTNGDAISGWDAQVTGGRVNALTVSGSKLYLGGYFQTVGGVDQAYAAAVSTDDGSLTGWNPKPDYGVNAIATAGSSVDLGGSFTHVGPSPNHSAHAFAA